MIKKLTLLISFALVTFVSHSQIVISEIMYNPPESGADSLEYIELYNATNQEVLLNGFTFGEGVEHDFTSESIAAGSYLLLCKNAGAMMTDLGVVCTQWDDGSLSNGLREHGQHLRTVLMERELLLSYVTSKVITMMDSTGEHLILISEPWSMVWQ